MGQPRSLEPATGRARTADRETWHLERSWAVATRSLGIIRSRRACEDVEADEELRNEPGVESSKVGDFGQPHSHGIVPAR